MWVVDWIRKLFGGKLNRKTTPTGTIEKEFGVYPAVSRTMEDNINLWYAMYTNHPPWETCDIRPLGIPTYVGRELARYALMEFSVTVSGGERAKFLNEQMEIATDDFAKILEFGLCLGGVALKPYPDDNGRVLVDVSATDFTPTKFDGTGKVIGGVFKSQPLRQGDNWFVRMEYHDFQTQDDGSTVYVIENKAFSSDQSGSIGGPVDLHSVDEWSSLSEREWFCEIDRPLFAYFKPPVANNIEPESQLGISVYAGATVDLIRQADEQWQLIQWEYKSGKRKIYADGVEAEQFNDDIFVVGPFTNDGSFFEVFSPEFRDDPLYRGYQNILKQIEFNTGLSYGTLSDPEQTIQKTATATMQSKHNQHVTEKSIQKAFQATLDDLLYAMDVWCGLAKLAPFGTYKAEYNWGDGVLDDPDTRRQDMSMDVSLVREGLMSRLAFIMKWNKVDEATAKKIIAQIDSETEEDVEPTMEDSE